MSFTTKQGVRSGNKALRHQEVSDLPRQMAKPTTDASCKDQPARSKLLAEPSNATNTQFFGLLLPTHS